MLNVDKSFQNGYDDGLLAIDKSQGSLISHDLNASTVVSGEFQTA